MDEKVDKDTWEELERIVDEGPSSDVKTFVEKLPLGETALTFDRLDEEHRRDLLSRLEPDQAARIIDQIPDEQAAETLELLPPTSAAAILEELPSHEQADLIRLIDGFDHNEAEAILEAMDPTDAADARALSSYEVHVAGGLMVAEYLSFQQTGTVSEVIQDLRENSDRYRGYDVQYAYVTDKDKRLVGVLRLRDLLLASGGERLDQLMIRNPRTVTDQLPLEELDDFFERYQFVGAPVVNGQYELVGVLLRSAVEEALSERAESDYRKSQGIVGGEELRSMPVRVRSRRRLAWLSINIVLNVIAASVISYYQDTLSQVIALAVFLPMISDMSGCSGNQAVAVSMRELSLGLVRPTEVFRVWCQEIAVGMVNGLALGLLIALVAWIWKGDPILGGVVGLALALNTIVAVSIGGVVPLLLRRLELDPALASGPILTTLTDMCGFFLALSLASMALPYLGAQ